MLLFHTTIARTYVFSYTHVLWYIWTNSLLRFQARKAMASSALSSHSVLVIPTVCFRLSYPVLIFVQVSEGDGDFVGVGVAAAVP